MNLKAVIVEFIGTFAFCFVGAGSIMVDAYLADRGPGLVGIALAHGLILSIFVTASMNISGGHINPAVTFAMACVGRVSIPNAVAYVIAQLAGGTLAGLLLAFHIFGAVGGSRGGDPVSDTMNGTPHFKAEVLGDPDMVRRPAGAVRVTPSERGERSGGDAEGDDAAQSAPAASQSSEEAAAVGEESPAPARRSVPTMRRAFMAELEESKRKAAIKALAIEAIITFLLVFAIFGTAVDPRHPNVGGFGIGLTVAANILIAGPLTGAAMNPARVFGPGVVLQDDLFWAQQWVYWVGPLAGALVAALLYQFVILAGVAKKPAD